MVYSRVNIQSQAYDYQPFETGAHYTPVNTVYNDYERVEQLAGSFNRIHFYFVVYINSQGSCSK